MDNCQAAHIEIHAIFKSKTATSVGNLRLKFGSTFFFFINNITFPQMN